MIVFLNSSMNKIIKSNQIIKIHNFNQKYRLNQRQQQMNYNQLYNQSIMTSKLLCLILIIGISSCYYDCYGCERCSSRWGYCRRCYDNRYQVNGQSYCLCEDGYYDQGNSDIDCIGCPTGCSQCLNANNCTLCQNGYQLNNLQCIQNGTQTILPDKATNQAQESASSSPVIGIVAGTIGAVVLIIALIIVCKKCKRRGLPEAQAQFYANKQEQTTGVKIQNCHFKKEICSICIDESIAALCVTHCGHYYHENCISLWLGRSPNCPNCVRKIEINKIRKWCSRCKEQLLMPLQKNSKMVKVGAAVKIQIKGKKDKKSELYYSPTCNRCQKRPKPLKIKQEYTEFSFDLKIN